LVVVTIIGILAGMAIPTFSLFARRQALNQSAENIASDLRAAQSQAISSVDGRCWGVHLTEGAANYTVFATVDTASGCASYNWRVSGSDIQKTLSSGVVVKANTGLSHEQGGQANVIFDRLEGTVSVERNDGGSLGLGLKITLRATWAGEKMITVGAGGDVSVQ